MVKSQLGLTDCGCDPCPPGEAVTLFVMDAPNVTGCLAEVIGHTPGRDERVQYEPLLEWLQAQAGPNTLIAKVFVNKASEATARSGQYVWLQRIHRLGFHYFAKPRHTPGSDVDDDMVRFIWKMTRRHQVKKIVLASNDGRCFEPHLLRLVKEFGVEVTILGFYNGRSRMAKNPLFTFVHYRKIPGVLKTLTRH